MEKKKGHKVTLNGDINTHWFTDILNSREPTPKPVEVGLNDTAVLMYTGGTTGVSKP